MPLFGGQLELGVGTVGTGGVSALSPRREMVWERVKTADFLTADEKRAAVGYGPLGESAP